MFDPTPISLRCLFPHLRALAFWWFGLCCASAVLGAAPANRKSFDIPAGAALSTLKQFTAQSGGQLLYSADAVEDVRTAAVKGQFTPLEALHRMFVGTELTVVHNERDGGLTIRRQTAEEKNGDRAAQPTAGDRPMKRNNLRAGEVASPEDQRAVELSPFVVNTSKDVGYQVQTTLAGTRTNTEIKDIANPLDIITGELMQDLAVQDIQDLTTLANNVETLGAAGDANAIGAEWEIWNYNYMQIRGFKTGTVTRNFMDLNGQFEAYNSERVEFSKGPNAILSGAGNPGGSVNYSTKVPGLIKDAYAIQHVTDDLGSQRASVDVNQVILRDVLAFRLNALWEDQSFYHQPSYERQKAWHLVGRWQPTRRTTLTVGHESRSSERASPRKIFAKDRVTAWLAAGAPLVTAVPSNNNVVIAGSPATRTAASLGMATRNAANWILDSDGVIRNTNRTAMGDYTRAYGNNNMDTFATGFNYPNDVWMGGANGVNDSDWNITEINLTHQITRSWFFDLAYGRSVNGVFQAQTNGTSLDLNVDTNNFGDNRHPGELYVEHRPFWIDRNFEIDHYRATTSYELDLTRTNKWFGRHQAAAVYERNRRLEWQNNGRLTLVQTPAGPVDPAAFSGGFQNAALAFSLRDYLNPATGKVAMYDLRGIYYSDGIAQDGYVARYLRREGYASYNNLTSQDTAMAVVQSRWLDGRLITTVGARKDRRREKVAPFVQNSIGLWEPEALVAGTPAGETHPKYAAFLDAPIYDAGISRNYGAVLHATKWLSFTVNYATNFSPRVESRGIFGGYVPASTGESTDYGIRLNLFDNRWNISLLRYETSELGSPTNGNQINTPFNQMQQIENILVDHGIIASTPLVGVFTTADRTGHGEELSIIGNPTRNWTLRLTGSRLINEQRNLAPEVRAYFAEQMPFYKRQDPNLTGDGSTVTLATRIQQAETSMSLMNARENVRAFPATEYNAHLTAKYTFDRDTFLKGVSAGASTRWSSSPIVGYYRTAANTFDITRPYKAPEQTYTDLFFTYQRRFAGKFAWRIQLNIGNVFNKTDPQPTAVINSDDAANFTWVGYRFKPIDGRVFTLTNTISF